jgi:hypothetical protein
MGPKHHGLGDAPIEDKYRRKMNALAKTLDEWFNGNAKGKDRKVGFCLMLWEFGDQPGRCNYISNATNRAEVVTLLKEQLARFEGQAEPKEGKS